MALVIFVCFLNKITKTLSLQSQFFNNTKQFLSNIDPPNSCHGNKRPPEFVPEAFEKWTIYSSGFQYVSYGSNENKDKSTS